MERDITTDRELIEQIARTAHEVNRVYCCGLGDSSQPAWDNAPAWQKESTINGVIFALQNPDVSPEQLHENWRKEKIQDGWKFGLEKDPKKKTYPCMLDYANLPESQKTKDYFFQAVVRSFDKFRM